MRILWIDIAVTFVDMLGAEVPGKWDAASFKDAFEEGKEAGWDSPGGEPGLLVLPERGDL